MRSKKVTTHERMEFWSYLAHLTGSSIPLVQSLELIGRLTKNTFFQEVIDQIVGALNEGTNLSDALKKYPKIFSNGSLQLILLAEQTGNYASIFHRLEQQEKWNHHVQLVIRQSLRYPALLFGVMIVFMAVLLGWLIPNLKEYLSIIKQEHYLPMTTTLIYVGNHLPEFAYGLVILILGSFFVVWGRRRLNFKPLRYSLPGIGVLLYQLQILNFGFNMGVLLRAKIDVLGALFYAAESLSCPWLKAQLSRQEAALIQGKSLSQTLPLVLGDQFIVSRMIVMGERSGNLDNLLIQMSEFELQHTHQKLKGLLDLLQPLMIIFMGLLLAWTVLAILLPLYQSLGASYG